MPLPVPSSSSLSLSLSFEGYPLQIRHKQDWGRNSVKERDPICAWTNGIAQAARGKSKLLGVSPSQQAWHRFRAQKLGAWKHFYNNPFFICDFSIQKCGCRVWQGCSKDSAPLAQTGVWILVSLGEYLRTHLKDHTRYDQGLEIHNEPRRVSLPFGEAQLAGRVRVQVGGPL